MTGAHDDNAPATAKELRLVKNDLSVVKSDVNTAREDLRLVKEDLRTAKIELKQEIYDAVKTVMYRIDDLEGRMATKEDIATSERRIITVMEKWRLDMVGVHKDKISQHEDRITRLEIHTGLIAA